MKGLPMNNLLVPLAQYNFETGNIKNITLP